MTSGSEDHDLAAITWWWQHANTSTRQRVREADYYEAEALTPALVSTFWQAGVDLIDAHLDAGAGQPRGYYLPAWGASALRSLDVSAAAPRR